MSDVKVVKKIDVDNYNPFGMETKTVTAEWWPDEFTVTVKQRSFGDDQDMQKANMGKFRMPKSKADAARIAENMEVDISLISINSLLYSIDSWTLSNNGETMPVDLESVRKLSNRDGDFIMAAIKELNPDADDDDFQGDGGIGSENGQGSSPRRNDHPKDDG